MVFPLLVAAGLLAPTAAAAASLVQVRAGTAATVRAAGGTVLAPELRIWRVPDEAVGSLRRAGVVVRGERERALYPAGGLSALDEPLASTEWWRSVVGADAVPAPGPSKPVTVIDSGVDVTHPEFVSRPDTTMLNEQTLVLDDDDHGTEVASVVGAPINGVGLAGVYPQAVLRSWDASPVGFISSGSVVKGIVTAARMGPGVINLSFGGSDPDPLIENALLFAFRKGSLVVASSGNDGLVGSPLSYPASYPHVLTVGATDETGGVTSFSSESVDVDLAAPGRHIPLAEPLSYDPTGYITASGTSYSAPIVAGAAAWVWTARPQLVNTQLFDLMRQSAHDLVPAGFDRASGFGMLDIPHALSMAAPAVDPLEPNDEIDQVAPHRLFDTGGRPLTTVSKHTATVRARVDVHEDPNDVYRAFVAAHGSLTARTSGGTVELRIFRTNANSVTEAPPAATAKRPGSTERVTFHNAAGRGVYVYVDVRPGAQAVRTPYVLRLNASARR
jgi:subtilisin family serine protease